MHAARYRSMFLVAIRAHADQLIQYVVSKFMCLGFGLLSEHVSISTSAFSQPQSLSTRADPLYKKGRVDHNDYPPSEGVGSDMQVQRYRYSTSISVYPR